ncbi:MAG: hypothetical protein HRF50_06545 [Phycisphaerae bacterium]|jgi:membrane protease subunit HflK
MADHHHGHDSHGHSAAPERPFRDPAQESLSQALRFGFRILGLIMVLLLVAYVASGLFRVNPGEQGLIVRFGRLVQNLGGEPPYGGTYVFGPGWHRSWPEPIDEHIPLSGEAFKLEIASFLFPRPEDQLAKPLPEIVPAVSELTPGVHNAMLSGDRNLSHGLWRVEYRIEDAEKFVRNVGERVSRFEPLLRAASENAIVHVVAGLPVERIIFRNAEEGVVDFVSDVQRRVNEELERLATGVVVSKITAETVEPGVVRQAFLNVTRAQNERESSINAARQQALTILNEAAGAGHEALLREIEAYGAAQATREAAAADALAERRARIDDLLLSAEGGVAKRLREAQSRASEIRERVRLEFEEFVYYRSTFRQYPQLTAVRLWVQMREAVLGSKQNEVFFVPADAQEIEILTNRDPQRLIDADIERYQKRFETPRP